MRKDHLGADRSVSRSIYALKRRRGVPAVIERESVSTNITTGEVVTEITARVSITRAILLPKKITADFVYDLSYVAANKNFTYGGFFNTKDRFIFIDARDLGTFVLRNDSDVILISSRRYKVKQIEEYDEGGKTILYIVTAQDLEVQPDVQS